MTRVMYDCTDINDLPSSYVQPGILLAGYVNGGYRTYQPLKDRYPHNAVVSIDVLNHPGAGQVLDIETGDATPDEAPAWFDRSKALGVVRPTLYCNSSTFPEVRAYMADRKADYWVAEYGPKLTVSDPGIVAWQKQDHGPNGENIDISDVFDPYWPLQGGFLMALSDSEQQEILTWVRENTRPKQSTTLYGAVTHVKDDGKAYKDNDDILSLLNRIATKLGA